MPQITQPQNLNPINQSEIAPMLLKIKLCHTYAGCGRIYEYWEKLYRIYGKVKIISTGNEDYKLSCESCSDYVIIPESSMVILAFQRIGYDEKTTLYIFTGKRWEIIELDVNDIDLSEYETLIE